MSKMEFKAKTATEALEKIANAPREYHWGCDQIFIYDLPFEMSDVQDYAKATLNNQPKLSILKKIAELADKEFNQRDDVLSFGYSTTEFGFDNDELREWVTNDDKYDYIATKRANILAAYLAGKALGVELVEVEG